MWQGGGADLSTPMYKGATGTTPLPGWPPAARARREGSAPKRARSSPCMRCQWSPAAEPHTARHGIVTAYGLCSHTCLGRNASPVWIASHHFVPLSKPTPIKTTLDPHANQACDKAEAEAGRGPASAVLFCHGIVPAGTCARLQWTRAGLREEWDDAAVPREQLRSAWQGSWRTAPERPTRNSGWALSGAFHSSWHHLPRISSIALAATSKRTRGSLFESACVDLWPFCTQDACDVDMKCPGGPQTGPGAAGPKMGPQSGR